MGRPREHDDSTRAALLAAAEELLARDESLSVRALADATSTTTRAVYSVFGSMDGVYRALLGRAFDEIRVRVEALPLTEDPRADLVDAGLRGFRAFAIAHPELFRIGFERRVPGLAGSPDVPESVAAITVLAQRVHRCKALLGGRRAHEVTWQFHSFCQGLASVELHGWLGADPEHQWRDALMAFVVGLEVAPRKIKSGSGRSGASR